MYVIDQRNKTLFVSFVVNGIIIGLQGLTYVSIVQPPETPKLNGSTLAYYAEHFNAQGASELDPAAAAQSGLNADVVDCGTALITQLGVTFAHEALLFMLLNALFVNELLFVPMICQEKKIFHREHAANAYSATAWHLAWFIKMLCQSALKLTFYPPMYYFAARLKLSLTSYLVAAFLTGGMGFAGSATAMLVAAVIPEYTTASTTFTFLVLVMQNVCGFYLSLDVVPKALSWLAYLSVYYYGYEMFRLTQVETNRLWSSTYETTVVFVLSTVIYAYAFLYHAVALGATATFQRKRCTYIDMASHSPPGAPSAAAAAPPAVAAPAAVAGADEAPSPTATAMTPTRQESARSQFESPTPRSGSRRSEAAALATPPDKGGLAGFAANVIDRAIEANEQMMRRGTSGNDPASVAERQPLSNSMRNLR